MTLSPKKWISDVGNVQIFEIGKNFSGQTAAPSEYTGGTQFWVPRIPWVEFWVFQNFVLAEPSPGFRQFRRAPKTRQNARNS